MQNVIHAGIKTCQKLWHPMFIVSVVAHVDHGKTTLLDSMLSYARIISRMSAGQLRYLDTRDDEQERGITLKLSFFQAQDFIFIDTPGHVDFESLIECSARLCDHFIFIVDVNEGITPRTLSLLTLMRGKQCVLVLNKIDKLLGSIELVPVVHSIVQSMNACLNEQCFEWSMNNIVVCSSTASYGVNYGMFGRIKENSTLKDVLIFLFLMSVDDTCAPRVLHRRAKLMEMLDTIGINERELRDICPLAITLFDSLRSLSYSGLITDEPDDHGLAGEHGEKREEEDRKMGDDEVRSRAEKKEEDDPKANKGITGNIEGKENIAKNVEQTTQGGVNTRKEWIKDNKYADKEDTECLNGDESGVFTADHHAFLCTILPAEAMCAVIGITTYAMVYEHTVLFITRLFTHVEQGMVLFSNSQGTSKRSTITKIYEFSNNRLIESKSAKAPNLVAIQSDFLRNSILSTSALDVHENVLKTRPFYIKKIKPWSDMKERIKQLSYCEPILKAKINRYGEVELLCEGHMHFEKIAHDLKYEFDEIIFYDLMCEGCGDVSTYCTVVDGLSVCLIVGPSEERDNEVCVEYKEGLGSDEDCDENGGINTNGEEVTTAGSENTNGEEVTTAGSENMNGDTGMDSMNRDTSSGYKTYIDQIPLIDALNHKLRINDDETHLSMAHALKSEMKNVVNVFTKKGPLLHEKVSFTSFRICITRKGAHRARSSDLFAKFLRALIDAYESTLPIPIVFYYRCKLHITEQYVGKCYKLLNKYHFKMLSNEYDETNCFFIIKFHIRRYLYNDFNDELKSMTKGTFYVHTWEEGYVRYVDDWESVVVDERRRKGICAEEVIVSEPEKQRTLKK
ncbi:small GTP-binding protein domain [Vavraia culicis subsp. floridensis]|uniref:Small GTP-binding protein domain n=1 Tax=Vavraia culicis (isolate floridensis) TaxID=948595 RepID=L2GXA4_VAVCU|nr:small GTP-binding protein domain [Vavraia culicis subsp. floridensis]ELA48311.1 small GTP-binding protein domain [Vavraia culicis subsp. floridensis]